MSAPAGTPAAVKGPARLPPLPKYYAVLKSDGCFITRDHMEARRAIEGVSCAQCPSFRSEEAAQERIDAFEAHERERIAHISRARELEERTDRELAHICRRFREGEIEPLDFLAQIRYFSLAGKAPGHTSPAPFSDAAAHASSTDTAALASSADAAAPASSADTAAPSLSTDAATPAPSPDHSEYTPGLFTDAADPAFSIDATAPPLSTDTATPAPSPDHSGSTSAPVADDESSDGSMPGLDVISVSSGSISEFGNVNQAASDIEMSEASIREAGPRPADVVITVPRDAFAYAYAIGTMAFRIDMEDANRNGTRTGISARLIDEAFRRARRGGYVTPDGEVRELLYRAVTRTIGEDVFNNPAQRDAYIHDMVNVMNNKLTLGHQWFAVVRGIDPGVWRGPFEEIYHRVMDVPGGAIFAAFPTAEEAEVWFAQKLPEVADMTAASIRLSLHGRTD